MTDKGSRKPERLRSLFIVFLQLFIGTILILIGLLIRPHLGEILSIIVAQIGAILIGLSVSQW